MINIRNNVAQRDLSTMMTVGTARYVVEWENVDDLRILMTDDAYRFVRAAGLKAIGEGSNLLFVSDDYQGALLKCVSRDISVDKVNGDDVYISADAGVLLDDLVRYCCGNNLWGIENLSLIPGTVGAAAVQNVGAYGVEFKDVVSKVDCYDMSECKACSFDRESLRYGYRDSIFKHSGMRDVVVTSVTVKLSLCPEPQLSYGNISEAVGDKVNDIISIRDAVIALRRSKLPEIGETGSVGSFFKNPVVVPVNLFKINELADVAGIDTSSMPVYEVADGVKLSAAWLIDRAGWKGVTMGHAGVWPRQPLVLVNVDGYATGKDIEALATAIREDVAAKFGVMLQPEAEYL